MMTSSLFKPLSSYGVLSFDVFGTIVDWESGIFPHLLPLTAQLAADHPMCQPFPTKPKPNTHLAKRHPLIAAYDAHEGRLTAAEPKILFEEVLRRAYLDLAKELGVKAKEADANAAAASLPSWPAFTDSLEAMNKLGKHYKLIGLSNVSNAGIQAIMRGPLKGVPFEAIYTAQDIGSYKPAKRNFDYLLAAVKRFLDLPKDQVLHVAHGVKSDQLIAEEIGLAHIWVERGVDNWEQETADGMQRLRIVADLRSLVLEMEKEHLKKTY